MAALGGGEAAGPAPATLERRKQASGTATLTPACLCACFCRGSVPDVRWVWQHAWGGLGLCFLLPSEAARAPQLEQRGGCQLQEGLCPTVGPCSLQVMYFSSLFPYVVLACVLVRGLLLRGAIDGILHMFTPKVRVTGSWGTRTALLGLICFMQFNTH